MSANALQIQLHTEQPLIERLLPSQRTLEIIVRPPAAAQSNARPPLNLALVLDRSGSMSGDKLEYVKTAAVQLLELLSERDRVAVVAYDDQVSLVSSSEAINPATRARLQQRIQAIRSGGSTNLSDGWLSGCREVAQHLAQGQLNRALLLTDGLANCGIQDAEELAVHARNLYSQEISTSTFGVGEGVNEHLLEAMSTTGGGSYYYIGSPHEIPGIFQAEFSELAAATARDVEIHLEVPAGVAAQVLGAWRSEVVGGKLRIFLGALASGREQAVYVNLLFPPAGQQSEVTLQAQVLGHGADNLLLEDSAALTFSYAAPEAVRSGPQDLGVLERASQVRVAEAANQSLKQERIGEREQAYRGLRQAIDACQPYMKPEDVELYEHMARRMRQGMDETDRKLSHNENYQKRRSK